MNKYYIIKSKDIDNNSPKDLLIVGNGFDLYCGLKSTFINFFAYLIQTQIEEMSHKSFNDFNSIIDKYVGEQYIKKYNISSMHLNDKDSKFVKRIISLFSRYHHNLYPTNSYIRLSKLNMHFNSSYFIYLLLKLWGHGVDNNLDVSKNSIGLYKCFNMIYKSCYNNFWIMYFEMLLSIDHFDKHMYFNNNWSDIEHNLMIFMTKYSENICKYVDNLINLYEKNNDLSRNRNNLFINNIHDIYKYNVNSSKKVKDKIFDKDKLMKSFIINMSVVLLIKAGFFKKNKNISHNNLRHKFYEFLYQQLITFEDIFSKYMYIMMHKKVNKFHGKGQEMIKTRYLHIVPKLINQLIPENNASLNLLSFNYVKLHLNKYNSKTCNNNKIQVYKPIHSVLTKNNGHPIIGISADRCRDKNSIKPYIIFSKSFRIMKLSNTLKNTHVLPDKKDIRNIIFFGHSLDPSDDADYPYFQSIFDKYDIYNSNVRLIFCYGVFDSNHYNMDGKNDKCSKKHYEYLKNEQAVNMFHKVSTLLSKYECTLHNKDLWSKLLIEDRLILHCVNDSYKDKPNI